MGQQEKQPPTFRQSLEKGFSRFGHFICRHRLSVVFFCFLIAGLMLLQLPKITYDTSAEGLLHPDDPALVDFAKFREQFGTDQSIIVLLQPPQVFDVDFLKKLTVLHAELEKIDNVEDVRSLVNTTGPSNLGKR